MSEQTAERTPAGTGRREPILSVRNAMHRVEQGELDTEVQVRVDRRAPDQASAARACRSSSRAVGTTSRARTCLCVPKTT